MKCDKWIIVWLICLLRRNNSIIVKGLILLIIDKYHSDHSDILEPSKLESSLYVVILHISYQYTHDVQIELLQWIIQDYSDGELLHYDNDIEESL